MSDKVRPSFDQHVAKKGEPAAIKDAREKYEAAVKKLAATAPDDKDYQKVRDAKREAGIALSNARQKAEADYYAEEVAENVKAITEARAAGAVKPAGK